MVINRLGYKVSTIGLISKHGFMKLVSQCQPRWKRCSSKEKSVMIFVGLSSNHERLREWLTCEARMLAQSQAEEDCQGREALAERKRNPPASAVIQQ